MNTLDKCREEHIELTSMIADLQFILTPERLQNKHKERQARQLLNELFDKIFDHLHAEDKEVYPDLLVHEDAKIKSMAWGFISGEHGLRQMVGSYHRKWLKGRDHAFSEAFLKETNEIFDLLVDRIDREEKVLFPRLAKSSN